MKSILIMDDDDKFRKMLRKMLEIAGYEVVEAPDGEVGMELYRENPTDLIILDIFMPWKEGLETIMELRRDFPESKILAISGGGKMGYYDYLAKARRLGAQKSLTKPFERQEMLEVIEELLAQGEK